MDALDELYLRCDHPSDAQIAAAKARAAAEPRIELASRSVVLCRFALDAARRGAVHPIDLNAYLIDPTGYPAYCERRLAAAEAALRFLEHPGIAALNGVRAAIEGGKR